MQKLLFLKVLAVILAIVIAVTLVSCGLRRRAERVCVPVFSVKAPYAGYYHPKLSFLLGIVWFGLLIFTLTSITFQITHLTAFAIQQPLNSFTLPVLTSFNLTIAIIQYWWGYRYRQVEIGIYGIVRQSVVTRKWTAISKLEWNTTTGELKGNFGFIPRMAIQIPLENREQMTQILEANHLIESTCKAAS